MKSIDLVKLEKLCKMQSGGTPSRKNSNYWENGKILWAKISDLENSPDGFIYNTEEKISPEGLKSINNRIFSANTLFLAMYGSVGKVAISKVEMSTNQAILGINVIDENKLDLLYLKFWFNKTKEELLDKAVGVALKNISLGLVKDLEIPLPSLSVQKAIAEKLDQADALRKKDQELLAHYDELAQSVFIEMFGDPVQNEMGWEKLKLENVCNKITDGEHTTPKRELEGVYLLSARNVKNGFIDLNVGVDYISEDEYTRISKRCMPENGDVLISCSGSVGRVSIVNVDYKFSLVRSVALLKVKKDVINPLFLNYYMLTNYFKQQIDKGSKKSSQANIFIGAIKELITIIPPLALQTAFAEKIKNIELQKALVKRQAEQSEDLFQALLQESFSF